MVNKIFNFLTESNVPADELGKNWIIFEIIAITLSILPWIVLIIYLVFLRKYKVRYFVDNELVHEVSYKKNNEIIFFEYDNVNVWYIDEECVTEFSEKFITKNIKLYGKR